MICSGAGSAVWARRAAADPGSAGSVGRSGRAWSGLAGSGRGLPLLGLLQFARALALQQRPHLRFPEAPVSARGADAADPAGRRPAGHGLGVDAKQRSHLAGGQETISSFHGTLLASTQGARSSTSNYSTLHVTCPSNTEISPLARLRATIPPARRVAGTK